MQRTILPNVIWITEKFGPKIHDFTVRNSSTEADINYSLKIINFFQSFVSEELVECVVEKANKKRLKRSLKKKNNNIMAHTVLS